LTFDWRRYLSLAEDLSKRDEEAAHRCAVSRAYYSAYCYARDRAGINTEGLKDPHKMVAQYYEGRKVAKLRDFGANQLPALHRSRKTADYDENAEVNATRSKWAVLKAREIVATLEKMTKEQIVA
jgi:uncharacterized protein (UPF0332 family)